MNSFTAQIILKLNAGEDCCAIKDVFVAVRARSRQEALERARRIGRRYDGRAMECPAGDAIANFHDVRRVTAWASGAAGDEAPVKLITDGVELATLDLELSSWADLDVMSDGGIVEVAFDA